MIQKIKQWFEFKRLRKWNRYIDHDNKIQVELQHNEKTKMKINYNQWV